MPKESTISIYFYENSKISYYPVNLIYFSYFDRLLKIIIVIKFKIIRNIFPWKNKFIPS